MKKLVLSLAVVFALGMVSCGGNGDKKGEENKQGTENANGGAAQNTDAQEGESNDDGTVEGEVILDENGNVVTATLPTEGLEADGQAVQEGQEAEATPNSAE